MRKKISSTILFFMVLATIACIGEPARAIRVSEMSDEPDANTAAAEPEPGWDLVILRPFKSQPRKKYSLNEDLRTFSAMLAVHFAKPYMQNTAVRTWIAVGTPEQEDAIENAIFVQPDRYLTVENIVNFEALDAFAEEHQAHLILVSDIYQMRSEFENKTDPITGKYEDSTYLVGEMLYMLYDAHDKKVLWTGKHGASTRLGAVRWNAWKEERLSRYGWNQPVGDMPIVPDRNYSKFVEEFMLSDFGKPFKESYAAFSQEILNLVIEMQK